jgi:CHAT domain-containing protein
VVPKALKDLYFERHDAWAGKTMLLLSDEPYIPWELVWPWDIVTGRSDPQPWAATLRLLRWLRSDGQETGYAGPPATLTLSPAACIAPPDTNLAKALEEKALLRRLAQEHSLRDITPASVKLADVTTLLEASDYAWLHVASHGRFDPDNPDAGADIELEDAELLTPEDVVGPEIQGAIRARRPGFVLNTCHSGRQAWSLSRLGGWAHKFIGSGAGLFVAPMWPVVDQAAYDFAAAFYAALLAGQPVAAAAASARTAAYTPGDPSWLAYSVYAHPNARLVE